MGEWNSEAFFRMCGDGKKGGKKGGGSGTPEQNPYNYNFFGTVAGALCMGPVDEPDLVARQYMLLERGLYASPVYLQARPAPQTPADAFTQAENVSNNFGSFAFLPALTVVRVEVMRP